MAVDPSTYIGNFNVLLPDGSDPRTEADNNFRQIKSALVNSLANVKGAVTASHTELSYSTGVTSSLQPQINAKGAIAGQTWTGAHDFTSSTTTVATPSSGSHAANKTYVDGLVISATAPSWSPSTTATSKTLAAYEFCRVTASGQTISFPASPTSGVTRVGVEFASGITGTLNPGSNKIKGSSGTMTVNSPGMTLTFLYLDSTAGWVLGA